MKIVEEIAKMGRYVTSQGRHEVTTPDGAIINFYDVPKDNKIAFEIEGSRQVKDKFIKEITKLADAHDVTLRIMCADRVHINSMHLYSELHSFQRSLKTYGFTKDHGTWSFMTRLPGAHAVQAALASAMSEDTGKYFSVMKDIKIGATFFGEELKGMSVDHQAYCAFVIPNLIDSWFHGKLMNKNMKEDKLQLEHEIIEAFLFIKHHFIIPKEYPPVIHRITRLKGVDYDTVKKVRTALRPIQSWTKSEKAAKKFYKDFFEGRNKDTTNVARVDVSKKVYTPYALIDRDQIEVYSKTLMKFFLTNKDKPGIEQFVLSKAPLSGQKYLKINKKEPVKSYVTSVNNIMAFTNSPYIKAQAEIILDIPRETLIPVAKVVAAEDL
jgi:hypothetical protein